LSKLLYLVVITPVAVQADQVLFLADGLFESGHYYDAITEYHRFIFFNSDNPHLGYAHFKMGLAYRQRYEWHEAINALDFSVRLADCPQIEAERRLILGTTLMAWGNYTRAKFELIKVWEFGRDPNTKYDALFFLGIVSIYTHEWSEAREAFGKYYAFKPLNETKENEIIKLLTEMETLPYKSPKKARRLSRVFPGTGQIYSGREFSGINAMLLNTALFGATVHSLIRKEFQNAILIYYFLFSRYYSGNIKRAELYASEYNNKLEQMQIEKLVNLLREQSQ
jgi:tetratricopeptide (TPR) repeat protein